MHIRAILSAILICQLLIVPSALAQQSATQASTRTPVNLDLSSTQANLNAAHLGNSKAVDITVGGVKTTVTSATLLTPAEMMAVHQVMRAGQQSIQLGSLGNAVGGSFTLGSRLSQHISNLVIPAGVTAIDNASRSPNLNLTGNLTNAGNLFVLSTNPAVTAATISAANINNLVGGMLSSVLPAGGLPGFASTVASLNLNLNAIQNIINAGTITSSGSLALHAGGSIVNALPAGVTGLTPIMQAMNNVNLQAANIVNQGLIASQLGTVTAATAALNNAGSIQALSGNIQIQNLISNTLNVQNLLGSISARDSILFETLGTTFDANHKVLAKANLSVQGGDISAQTISFTSPEGQIGIDVNSLGGNVNISGGEAHVNVQKGNLNLGAFNVTGDPVIYVGSGDFTYSGDIFTQGNVFAVSTPQGGINITGSINTSPIVANGAGGDVILLSESQISVSGAIQTSGQNGAGGQVVVTTNNLGSLPVAISLGNITTAGTIGGNVLIASTGSVGDPSMGIINIGSINTSSTSQTGHAGAIAVVSTGAINIGTNQTTGPAINTSGAGSLQSGGVFISSGNPNKGPNFSSPVAIAIGSSTNTTPIQTGSDAAVILHAAGDILLGSQRFTSSSPAPAGTGGLGVFPRVASTFLGFPVGTDSDTYSFTITPQAAPTFTDGTGPYELVPGGFATLTSYQFTGTNNHPSINTSGDVTFNTNGAQWFLAPLVMPQVSIGGNITALPGTNGSASSIGIVSHQTLSLATGNASKTVSTQASAGGTAISGEMPGDLILVAGAGTDTAGILIGSSDHNVGSPVVVTGSDNNSVNSPGGRVLIAAAHGSLTINGDIVTSGTGTGSAGSVAVLAPFVPTTPSTVVSVGNILADNGALDSATANGGSVGVYSGSNLVVGTINTSGGGTGYQAGNITLEADNTALNLSSGPGVITAGNLIASGLNNANGGTILLDSGSQQYHLSSLITRSANGSNVTLSGTGSGTSGDVLFTTNMLQGVGSSNQIGNPLLEGVGSILISPGATFQSDSFILVDGTRSNPTSYISLSLPNGTSLGDISTQNLGTGAAGSVALFSNGQLGVGRVITSAASNNAGSIYLSAGASGNLSVLNVEAVGSNTGRSGGTVYLVASGGAVNIASTNTSGTNGATGGSVILTAGLTALIGSSSPDSHGLFGITTAGTAGAGSITVTAGQGVVTPATATFNIDASSTSGLGGNVTIASAGNNGAVSVSINDINTSGTRPGSVEVVSLDETVKYFVSKVRAKITRRELDHDSNEIERYAGRSNQAACS